MKKQLPLFCLLGLFLSFSGFAQNQEIKLAVEPNHSTIGFSIDIAGGATAVTGKFTDFDLHLLWREGDLTKSEARFIIQAASINTGIAARDEHLLSADFFDVDRFPEIVFQSRSIKQTPDGGFSAKGVLSMHGVDKLIDLPFKLVYAEGNTLGFEIRTQLNRMDYGVGAEFEHTGIDNFLAEEVDLRINFWTRKAKEG